MGPVDWEGLWNAVPGPFRGRLMLVEKNGLGGEGILVVRLFAALHDSQRVNDGWDEGHGARGAAYARAMRGSLFEMEDKLFKKLEKACAGHELGMVSEDGLIGSCWDADRLDLVREGALP